MKHSLVCTGREAVGFAERINPNSCFLSCKGSRLDGKLTDTSEEETEIRRAFLQNSKTRVMLMTHNKLGSTYFHTLCHARDVDDSFSDAPLSDSIQTRMGRSDSPQSGSISRVLSLFLGYISQGCRHFGDTP